MIDSLATELFSADYAEARVKFLAAAAAASAKVESLAHPQSGPGGVPLYMDVAITGREDAESVLIVASGTHGVEGFAGSAVQIGLLRTGELAQSNIRWVLIHAVNPYGFAYLRRFNEDNVDLNRNFLNHTEPYPLNRDYEALADAIAPDAYWKIASGWSLARLLLYRLRHGEAALQSAVTGGQYTHPSGLFFGGHSAAWSNRAFHDVLAKHVEGASPVVFIDVHTGLGPYGRGELITDRPSGSPEYRRGAAWWSDRLKATAESVSTHLTGTIKSSTYMALPQAQVTAVTLEFGTYSNLTVLRALQAENWLFHHGGWHHPRARSIKAAIRRAFYPDGVHWKVLVWTQAKQVVEQAVLGLSARRA